MTIRGRVLLSAAVLVAALAIAAGAASAASGDALRLELAGSKGPPVRLADFAGKVVLVKIWASWCPQCQQAFPQLSALQRELRPRGVEIVAVNVDDVRKRATAFLAEHPTDMVVAFDPRARMLEALGAAAIPASFVFDRRGVVRYRHTGYDAATLAAYRQEIETLLAERP